jgi:hypothetical protein
MSQFVSSNSSKNEGGGGERVIEWLAPTIANFSDIVEIQSRTTLVIFIYEDIIGIYTDIEYPTISTDLSENYYDLFPTVINDSFSGEFETGITPFQENIPTIALIQEEISFI